MVLIKTLMSAILQVNHYEQNSSFPAPNTNSLTSTSSSIDSSPMPQVQSCNRTFYEDFSYVQVRLNNLLQRHFCTFTFCYVLLFFYYFILFTSWFEFKTLQVHDRNPSSQTKNTSSLTSDASHIDSSPMLQCQSYVRPFYEDFNYVKLISNIFRNSIFCTFTFCCCILGNTRRSK